MGNNFFKNPSQEFVYVRTYSKWLESIGRRETWSETVDRYISFIKEQRPSIPQKVLNKIREYMLALGVMPSMRALWAAGPAAEQSNVCMYNCSALTVDSVEAFAETLYILCCGAGLGFSVENKYIQKLPVVPRLTLETNGIHVIPDSKEGWADSIKILMNSLYEGKDIQFDYSLIRPAGSRLKTMGGRASGPEPLISLHRFIREVFNEAQGKKLTSIQCHDLMNKIAEIVVVGGVRRSSQISLSDLNDPLMANAKNWPFPLHRAMANNSAVYDKKPTSIEFLKEWSTIAASGTGERGIFNLYSVQKNAPARRNKEKILLTNPCVTGDTEILTDDGYKQIQTLIGQKVNVWNGFEWSEVEPKITGTNQDILTVNFSDGRTLNCTPYHKFHISTDYRGGTKIVEAKDLQSGMKLIKHEFPIIEHGPDLKHAYTQGFVSAEGMELNRNLWVYKPKEMCLSRLEGVKSSTWEENNNRYRVLLKETPVSKNLVPIEYNLKSKIEWLSGLFDGDGTELKEGGLQLVSVNREFLTNLQKLLSTVGVQSKVLFANKAGMREMPDGRGGTALFYCQDSYRICIGAVQMQKLKTLGLKCERMSFDKTPQRDASQFVSIVDVTENGTADTVYCFNEPKRHLGIFGGVITGQCGEVALRNMEFCNLSEVVVRAEDDLDSLMQKVETATWIGVIQSSFTNFPYLRKEWQDNCNEERLLGVSLTGQMDNKELLSPVALKALKQKALKVAKHAAQKMGINMSVAVTLGKPSGTVSQLVDSASGVHARFSKYYIRRYRISAQDPLCKMMKAQGIKLLPENGQEDLSEDKVSTWVVEFPIKSPEGSITKDQMSAIDQLEWYKNIQTNWCEHNQSTTIYCGEDEWLKVGNWVYENWNIVNGISFLPRDGGHYKLAPYESITEEKYKKLIEKFKPIDYTKLSEFEKEDQTQGSKELACQGGVCEL